MRAFAWMAVLVATSASAEPSRLYGRHGERWDPRGRLPDFSYAGYARGDRPIPEVPRTRNVRDFGAVGDGRTDDTAALLRAVDTATGAVFLPRGRYLLREVLRLSTSAVLRGEGPEHTVLVVPVSLSEAVGPRPQWSWSGGFLEARGPSGPARTIAIRSRVLRGDRTVTLTSTAGLEVGALVQIELTDDGSGSLGRHLHADRASAGDCAYQVPYRHRWTTRLAAIDGAEITFTEPLRTEIRAAWRPQLRVVPYLERVGFEHLAIEFPREVAYAGHLAEPGYNGISLAGVADGWVRNVRISNADSGIFVDGDSKNISIADVVLEGRMGHHGLQVAHSHDVLLERFAIEADFVHAMTVDHRASGNVFKRGRGAFELEMDHHRDAPHENLFSALTSTASFRSSGNTCAGPHSGARSTFWGNARLVWLPSWGSIQSNVIGRTEGDQRTEREEWYEPLDPLEPLDLHAHQLARRHAFEAGPPAGLEVRTPERWAELEGAWFLGTSLYERDGEALGELAVLAGEHGEVEIEVAARTAEWLPYEPDADLAVVFGHRGPREYDFALYAAGEGGGLYRVDGARVERLAAAPPALAQEAHALAVVVGPDFATMSIDGRELARASLVPRRGAIGVGALDDAAFFSELRARPYLAPADAGFADRGAADAAGADRESEDAKTPAASDAGFTAAAPSAGCGCRGLGTPELLAWPLLLLVLRGRRR